MTALLPYNNRVAFWVLRLPLFAVSHGHLGCIFTSFLLKMGIYSRFPPKPAKEQTIALLNDRRGCVTTATVTLRPRHSLNDHRREGSTIKPVICLTHFMTVDRFPSGRKSRTSLSDVRESNEARVCPPPLLRRERKNNCSSIKRGNFFFKKKIQMG